MNPVDLLVSRVQSNCHVSDARHARNLTLCTYLLEMREFYRWERGIAPFASLSRADVGTWIADREALWESLDDADYAPVPVAGREVDPFAVEAVNRVLVPQRLVYGAGVARFGKPQFFVATLEREEWRDGTRVLVAGRELARDLSPAPAALRDGTIYVRLEALEHWLWGKAEAWGLKRGEGAFKAALDAHAYAVDPQAALARMTANAAEIAILHELGEHAAGRELGPGWERLLAALTQRRTELFVRAVRDHLADCLVTLPALLQRDSAASLHLWFANLEGVRRELSPRLVGAYATWCAGGGGAALRTAVVAGTEHWRHVCAEVLALHATPGVDTESALEALSVAPASRF
jgi:hypothetical protein